MPTYTPPLEDFEFLLRDYLKIADYSHLPGYDQATELLTPVLEEGGRFCAEVMFPLNRIGDETGLKYEDGNVITPPGFKEAYKQYIEGGWMGFSCDPAYGGQGLPEVLNLPFMEMACSANLSLGMTPGLSHGAYNAIYQYGSEELKNTYLPKIVSGEWSGVMGLTEPVCGTDLGLMRSRAEPVYEPTEQGEAQSGGGLGVKTPSYYKITGGKIFITSGEHDKTENIIHLVLAKLPDAPAGVKGISLFLVPKILPDGTRNSLRCEGLEHKMGIHASPTCVMNYDGAKGWLVGEPHKGLRAMFTMMNEARLYVGLQGLGLGEVARQNAFAYAAERLQGRALTGAKYPEKQADPILVHPDVRRMLLTMRAFTEGARALALEAALNNDIRHRSEDKAAKEAADDWIQLMTPVIKAYFTDMGFEVASLAMQVHGGYGYIREYGVEQYTRDARIAMIYEGTNGIQALDLIGRKLPYQYGKYLRAFFHPVSAFIEENRDNPAMEEFTKPLYQNLKHLQNATLWMAKTGLKDPNDPAAGACDYLRMFALVTFGYVWARQAKLALAEPDNSFYQAKLDTARFFMQKMLPDCVSLLIKITNGSSSVMKAVI